MDYKLHALRYRVTQEELVLNDDLKLFKNRTTSRLKLGVCIKCVFFLLICIKKKQTASLNYVQGVPGNMTVGE